MTDKARHRPAELVGAIVSMPSTVMEDGVPMHPDMLVWMLPDGRVQGTELGPPGEVLPKACDSLRQTMSNPLVGSARPPRSIRVAAADLAEALRAEFPEVDVFVGPTPEVDALLAAMSGDLQQPRNGLLQALEDGVPEGAIEALFDAAREHFRAQPWQVFVHDSDVIGVSIESLGIHDAVISVIGQLGDTLGWVLFPDVEAYETQIAAARALERGEEATLPDQMGLTFDPVWEAPEQLVERADTANWPVASEEAWPNLLAVADAATTMRPLSSRDIAVAEAVTRALTRVARDPADLLAAQRRREEETWVLPIDIESLCVEVKLRSPLAERLRPLRAPQELLDSMLAIEDFDEEEARQQLRELQDELLLGLWTSPEAEALPELHWSGFVLDLAFDSIGATLPRFGPGHLEEMLFDVLPRKASIEPGAAHEIVAELEALFRYLARAGEPTRARACLQVLQGDTADRLQAALADPSLYGPAKQTVMSALADGVDMSNRDEMEAWMLRQQMSSGPPRRPVATADDQRAPRAQADAKKRKRKRKAARKARKRSK